MDYMDENFRSFYFTICYQNHLFDIQCELDKKNWTGKNDGKSDLKRFPFLSFITLVTWLFKLFSFVEAQNNTIK